jgi:hypothetical protein
MRGTPYVKRTVVWDRTIKTYISGKEIAIGERTWDGIDKPDYTDKFILNPDEARYVATELLELAEQIDGKKEKQSIIKKIRKNTETIIKEAKKEAFK